MILFFLLSVAQADSWTIPYFHLMFDVAARQITWPIGTATCNDKARTEIEKVDAGYGQTLLCSSVNNDVVCTSTSTVYSGYEPPLAYPLIGVSWSSESRTLTQIAKAQKMRLEDCFYHGVASFTGDAVIPRDQFAWAFANK